MELWIGAINLGFLYAFLAMGSYLTFRIFNFPDVTVDGSFTTGAAVAAVLLTSGMNPALAVPVAIAASFILGALAGGATAFIHTRFKINGLLAGILVMTGLYSINLHIMGRSNIPLLNNTTILTFFNSLNPVSNNPGIVTKITSWFPSLTAGVLSEIWVMVLLFLIIAIFWAVISFFFYTNLGLSMRATGNNPIMTAATGVNVNRMVIWGVALANGLVGVSGALVAQYQGFTDIGMGIGTVTIGLASVIIGESILHKRAMWCKVLSVIIGSVAFRLMIAFALYMGMNPIDLKLLTAGFVLLTLVISQNLGRSKRVEADATRSFYNTVCAYCMRYKWIVAAVSIVLLCFVVLESGIFLKAKIKGPRVGIVQFTENALLDITRDSFLQEMEKIGYKNGENCTLILDNAHGDPPIINSIIDRFLNEKVDIVVAISTPCTQAAINKIKDKPIVFATVASPFIIGAGTSETAHLPNVTGVYGWVPMDQMLAYAHGIFPGKKKVGVIWDPAQSNSVYNVELLKAAIAKDPDISFEGQTITNSSEVLQAAVSLVQKGIDMFILAPDNIVYSAFESIVKAASSRNVPIFMGDVERLADGALGVLGYDYTQSGIQTAHIVDRIVKGESPAKIPFERYKTLITGFNSVVAKKLGITISDEVKQKVTRFYDGTNASKKESATQAAAPKKKARIALVLFSENPLMMDCQIGFMDEIQKLTKDDFDLTFDQKCAQNEYTMAQSIAQDIVRLKYDYLCTFSTPMLQVCAQVNRTIPHIFGAVTDPYRMGVAKTQNEHQPNVTGVATFQPVADTIKLMREVFPNAKRIGVVWNPAEACSEACVYKARDAVKLYNFTLVEKNVSSTSEVMDALKSVASENIDLFITMGDNTVNLAMGTIADYLRQRKIPYFTNTFSDVDHNAFITLGADYSEVGRETARMASKVIHGANPKDVPINNFVPAKMGVNRELIQEYGLSIPEEFIKRAAKVKEKGIATSVEITPAAQPKRKARLALFTFNENPLLKECLAGFLDELKKLTGDKVEFTFEEKCAQNEFSMAQSIAQDIVRLKYDYVVTFATPVLQAFSQINKTIPHIFGFVTDPYRAGVAKSSTEHQENLTGVATFEPVENTFKLMRQIFPKAKRVGMIWNPAEACSEACMIKAREIVKANNFELVETTITSTSEVMDALKSMISQNIDIFYTSGDNTVLLAKPTIGKFLRDHKIPYFTNDLPVGQDVGLISLGTDPAEIGRETARVAAKVVLGANPKDVPIDDFIPEKLSANPEIAKELGITLPEELIKRSIQAAKLSAGNIQESTKTSMAEKRKARLALFVFNDNQLVKDCEAGFLDELKKLTGDKIEFTVDEKCAQNEFPMAQSIAQDIVRLKYDYMVSFSTPVSQAGAQINKTIPHIFGYVTDPYRAGLAKSTTEHQENLTGVATFEPVENSFKIMRQVFPKAKRIGMIWNPSEACSEACMIKAREAVKTNNFELVETTITSTSEVMDALKSMLNKKIDIFYTSGDNSVLLAKSTIGKFLRDHKIPYFTNDLPLGKEEDTAFISLGADIAEIGRETARMAAKVMLGANPKDVPIDNFIPEKLNVNLNIAKELGVTIPDELINRSIQAAEKSSENIPENTKTSMAEKQKARLALFVFNENPMVKKCQWGFQDELVKLTGDKIDYVFEEKCAQNDFPMIQTIAQDIVRLKYDYIITFSTPVLQAVSQANKTIPHIFGYVTDPYHAGVAKSETEHQANLTGVASFDPVENLIKIMRQIYPKAKRIGIIWNLAEACSEACMMKARVAAPANNFELVEKTVTGTSEIVDALKSMMNEKIDIFYTAGDNTVLLAKQTIGKFWRDHKIPYFTNDIPVGPEYALLSLGTEPEGIGREMAKVASKVILGANPKDVPIDNFIPEKLSVNPDIAKELGVKIPEIILERAGIEGNTLQERPAPSEANQSIPVSSLKPGSLQKKAAKGKN